VLNSEFLQQAFGAVDASYVFEFVAGPAAEMEPIAIHDDPLLASGCGDKLKGAEASS
jgi:hypothetical protein